MRHKLFGHILLVIVTFSFTAPFFSPHTYTFCPNNPENGFICYCIYKDNANKKTDNLVYSSGVKKQVDSEKFNALVLSVESPHRFITDALKSEKNIIPYTLFYKGISRKVPDKPPSS
jgi:hypothetical protein